MGRNKKLVRRLVTAMLSLALVITMMPLQAAYGTDAPLSNFVYNGTGYASLEEALAAVNTEDETEDVITFQKDVIVGVPTEDQKTALANGEAILYEDALAFDKKVTLDFSTHRVSGNIEGGLVVAKGVTITLRGDGAVVDNQSTLPKAVAFEGRAASSPQENTTTTATAGDVYALATLDEENKTIVNKLTGETVNLTEEEIAALKAGPQTNLGEGTRGQEEEIQPVEGTFVNAEGHKAIDGQQEQGQPAETWKTAKNVVLIKTSDSTTTDPAATGGDDPTTSPEHPQPATYKVTVKTYLGSTESSVGGKSLISSATVKEGGSVTVTNTPARMYSVTAIKVNGVNVGDAKKYTISNINKDTNIQVYYKKTGMLVMIDPGHGKAERNKGMNGYVEPDRMWLLSNYLVSELNSSKYPNIKAVLSKKTLDATPGVYDRGYSAKGYDLFISMHSNALTMGSSVDYPLAIVSSGSKLYPRAYATGLALVKCVDSVMPCNNKYQVWTKKQSNGQDWYGVIRGAAAVGVPAIILEHSFHTNPTASKWLMSDANLKKMAVEEAKVIGGLPTKFVAVAPSTPTGLKAVGITPTSNKISWGKVDKAEGYSVYRSDKKDGTYKVLKVTSATSYVDSNLAAGKTYYYKVLAWTKDLSGTCAFSAFSSPVAGTFQFSKMTVSMSATYWNITISWKKTPFANCYDIYRADSRDGKYLWRASVGGSRLGFIDTEVTPMKTYYYKVRPALRYGKVVINGPLMDPRGFLAAFNCSKNVTYSGNVNCTGTTLVRKDKRLPALSCPRDSVLTATTKGFTLSWNDIRKRGQLVSGYLVYRKDPGETTYKEIAKVNGSKTSYTDNTVSQANAPYVYCVATYTTDRYGVLTASERSMLVTGVRADSTKKNVDTATLNFTKKTMKKGQTATLTVTYPANSFSGWKRYFSSNSAVASVDCNTGKITAKKKGTATVYARLPGGRDIKCTITVR